MFLAQIHSIEDQIASLEEQMRVAQQQLQQYQNLREKADEAIALLKEIQQQSEAINEGHNWKNCVMHALQISEPQPPTPPTTHVDTESQDLQAIDEERSSEDSQVLPSMEESTINDSYYLNPAALAAVLENEDTDTVLMGIANLLDAAPAVEIEGRVWYFVQNLPTELCDRMIPCLPKSIAPEWRKQMDALVTPLAEEAKASIFPGEQPTTTYEPAVGDIVECLSSGQVGRITYICDSLQGEMATVLVPGGASNFHASNLRFIAKHEEEEESATTPTESTTDPELDQLARQCLGLRSWSQIRIFADSNPEVISKMYEIATTKAEKRIINNLPSLIVGYIGRAGDRSDLQWLPESILNEVETLMQAA